MVDDDTELTTLTGDHGKDRRLVEDLFQTEYGSATWGEVKLSTKDEFLDAYSSGKRAVRDKLAAWIRYNELEDLFEQAKQQQKYIFSDGLPELGPLSETTKFTSNPSVPNEEQHATASLQIATFSILSDLEELPCPKTNIWNHVISETGTLGGYSSEADVNSHVKRVIEDILEALGIRGNVTIRAEVEVMRNRPDFMLILFNGLPIGTIKCKQPGKDAMEHPNILGEVYDQLMHLHSIFRVNTPFAMHPDVL
jgi:hypothetical protein